MWRVGHVLRLQCRQFWFCIVAAPNDIFLLLLLLLGAKCRAAKIISTMCLNLYRHAAGSASQIYPAVSAVGVCRMRNAFAIESIDSVQPNRAQATKTRRQKNCWKRNRSALALDIYSCHLSLTTSNSTEHSRCWYLLTLSLAFGSLRHWFMIWRVLRSETAATQCSTTTR